jgi:hypothetical protein
MLVRLMESRWSLVSWAVAAGGGGGSSKGRRRLLWDGADVGGQVNVNPGRELVRGKFSELKRR